MAISAGFPVPDSDDTAMVANVLCGFGYPVEPLLDALLSFEMDTHFSGSGHERGAARELVEDFTALALRTPVAARSTARSAPLGMDARFVIRPTG